MWLYSLQWLLPWARSRAVSENNTRALVGQRKVMHVGPDWLWCSTEQHFHMTASLRSVPLLDALKGAAVLDAYMQ
jgi:hypothetical protein